MLGFLQIGICRCRCLLPCSECFGTTEINAEHASFISPLSVELQFLQPLCEALHSLDHLPCSLILPDLHHLPLCLKQHLHPLLQRDLAEPLPFLENSPAPYHSTTQSVILVHLNIRRLQLPKRRRPYSKNKTKRLDASLELEEGDPLPPMSDSEPEEAGAGWEVGKEGVAEGLLSEVVVGNVEGEKGGSTGKAEGRERGIVEGTVGESYEGCGGKECGKVN